MCGKSLLRAHSVTYRGTAVNLPRHGGVTNPKEKVTNPKEKVTRPKERVTRPKEKVTRPKDILHL